MIRQRSRIGRGVVASGVLVWVVLLAGCVPARSQGPDPGELFSDPDALGLARAVQQGQTDEIARLVAAGTDVESTGEHGTTMLQWAVMTNSIDGLSALLAAGADPDRTGHDGDGPLHLAAFHSDPAYLVMLLDAGADPDLPNAITGASALDQAPQPGHPQRPGAHGAGLARGRSAACDETAERGDAACAPGHRRARGGGAVAGVCAGGVVRVCVVRHGAVRRAGEAERGAGAAG